MAPTTDTHPLRSWRLGGFRAIKDTTTFELGGLNILVGPNSAGKSSVLYSLLMLTQTLANPLIERPLILNGHLVRLGLADDIVHEAGDDQLTLGFELAPHSTIRYRRRPEDVRSVTVDAHFRRAANNDFGLVEAEAHASPPEDASGASQSLIARLRTEPEAREALLKAKLSAKVANEWAKNLRYLPEGDITPTTVGVRVLQFLPQDIFTTYNSHQRELQWLQLALTDYQASGQPSASMPRVQLSTPTLTFLRQYVQETYGNDDASTVTVTPTTAAEMIPKLSQNALLAATNLLTSAWFVEHRDELTFQGLIEPSGPPPLLRSGLDIVRRWFAESVVHLGPLRAAPQPLYELPLGASERSVGRNGEFTAAVLHAHANTMVVAPSPSGGAPRQVRLTHAVNEWMSAMSLLSSVEARERGKLGFELHLGMEGVSRELDLTTVGVGVSQILPIIVLGLITAPGTLLLFEQPELHLHPDVQASLGDFFLALSRTGRQLIVETHSDYLINRLRRRAADDSSSDVPSQVRLFFFSRTGANTSVNAVRIAPGGGMPDWPVGFLDTASREVEAIARAGLPSTTGPQ